MMYYCPIHKWYWGVRDKEYKKHSDIPVKACSELCEQRIESELEEMPNEG